jgi:hypothetical protein
VNYNDLEFLAVTYTRNKEDASTLAMTIPAIKDHIDTWGGNTGTSKAVYVGHLVHMLVRIRAGYDLTDHDIAPIV